MPPDYSSLDPCVHCGFCLPACPTYLATGDEADSPRGRIVLMRALERGELGPGDEALMQHLDACLGCLGCEPVCPSGVGYGRGIQTAREQLLAARGLSPLARLVLGIFRRERLWRPLFTMARVLRGTGAPRLLANGGRIGFGMAMLAATKKTEGKGTPGGVLFPSVSPPRPSNPTVALFRGCVMDTLFPHVHAATRRTLEANGYTVVEVEGQTCCGALHEHAGDRASAQALAQENVAAMADSADFIVVNSAGCGALLKDYGHLLGTERAEQVAAKVRDVTELLADAGPRPGAPLPLDVAYDAPCHLQHAQRVHAAPLAVLQAIPELRLRLLPSSDKCCGSAGIYSLLRPDMARAVLDLKIQSFAQADPIPQVVTTGNPGCLMQIGAGIRTAGLKIRVAHPVELLDESYGAAGMYTGER
ncbi:MAG TPA: (Fe-S)-binding protein [Gemmatimonadales bacterium]